MTQAQLSIDYWHTTVVAAARTPRDRLLPITVDGATASPTGVAVDPDGTVLAGQAAKDQARTHPDRYMRMPADHVTDTPINFDGTEVDPVDLIAATLASIRTEAQEAGYSTLPAVISVPAGWSHRQRNALREAAARAGLGAVSVMTGAEAIVREQMERGRTITVGSTVLVVRLDATVGEVTMLHRSVDGFDIVVRLDIGEIGETPGATLSAQAAAALAEALRGSDTSTNEISTVFCQAPTGVETELAAALAAVGVSATPLQVPELAAAFGGLRSAATSSTAPVRRTRGALPGAAAGMLVSWAAAGALTYQLFTSAAAYPGSLAGTTWLYTEMAAWALIPVFVTLGATAAALALAHAQRDASPGGDARLGSGLGVAAALGPGAAAVLSLAAAQRFGTDPVPLLRWTLLSTAPLSLILIALGLVVARTGPPGATRQPWRDRLAFPFAAQLLAAVSTASIVASLVGVPPVDSSQWWRMQHIGAYLLGWAIACLVPVNAWRLMTVGFLLSATAAYAVGLHTVGVVTSCLVGAITLWWLLRLAPAIPALARRWGTRAAPGPG